MTFQPFKKLVLVVLDGFGIATASHGNAVTLAQPANIDHFVNHYPNTTLQASGPAVGLPWGEMGNSEVGHLNLGAGRIVGQDLSRITLSIEDRSFFKNQAFSAAVEHVKKHNSSLHLMGLVSPGGVHSYDEHLYALLGLASESKVKNVYIHMFTDGRDTPPQIALESLEKLMHKINTFGTGNIASISGRFYAMDRAEHWNLTDLAYKVMVMGNGPKATSVKAAIEENYAKHIFDEMIPPTVIIQKDGNPAVISENDAVIQFNFRPDRALQMTRALVEPGFDKFPSVKQFKNLLVVTMTEYAKDLPVDVAYPPAVIERPLARIFQDQNLIQLHAAETEKYAHITFFLNGGRENPFQNEDRILVPSPPVPSYDQKPEMSAFELTNKLLAAIKQDKYDFIVVNFANPDMVGHTGVIPATMKAVETCDKCLGQLVNLVLEKGGALFLTSDHGNCDEMINLQTGEVSKEHSTNPVPFLAVGRQWEGKSLIPGLDSAGGDLSIITPSGLLADIAPTILKTMEINQPVDMTGSPLI